MPAGRPVTYNRAKYLKMAKQLPDLFREGQSVAEVCVELGCGLETFYYGVDNYPEFSKAYEKGKEYSQAWWEALGRKASAGQHPIQPATWIFNMKNRFNWKDRSELTGKDDQPLFSAFADAVKKNSGESTDG